jgi:hypothetical protein
MARQSSLSCLDPEELFAQSLCIPELSFLDSEYGFEADKNSSMACNPDISLELSFVPNGLSSWVVNQEGSDDLKVTVFEESTNDRKRSFNSTHPSVAEIPSEKKFRAYNSGPWSLTEDRSLQEAVSSVSADCTDIGWAQISQVVTSRTSSQCWQRWNQVVGRNGYLNKGAWKADEDHRLITAIECQQAHQQINWHAVEEQVGTRRAMQCKDRWVSHLDPNLRRGSFTKEEYQKVWRLQAKFGNKFVKIASEMPGRSATRVKAAWRTILRKEITNRSLAVYRR